jgi:hypothetical protein
LAALAEITAQDLAANRVFAERFCSPLTRALLAAEPADAHAL